MRVDKRKVPLTILLELKELHEFFLKSTHIVTQPNDSIIHIHDKYGDSSFYFYINNYTVSSNDNKCRFKGEYHPASTGDLGKVSFTYTLNEVIDNYKYWESLVDKIENFNYFDDPLESQYREEFEEDFADFEILDDDADTRSFSLPIQRALHEAIEKHKTIIKGYIEQGELSEPEVVQASEIIEEYTQLQNNITGFTKSQIMKKLGAIWAKCRKAGLKFVKDVVTEAYKEALKQGTKALIEQGPNLAGGLGDIIS